MGSAALGGRELFCMDVASLSHGCRMVVAWVCEQCGCWSPSGAVPRAAVPVGGVMQVTALLPVVVVPSTRQLPPQGAITGL